MERPVPPCATSSSKRQRKSIPRSYEDEDEDTEVAMSLTIAAASAVSATAAEFAKRDYDPRAGTGRPAGRRGIERKRMKRQFGFGDDEISTTDRPEEVVPSDSVTTTASAGATETTSSTRVQPLTTVAEASSSPSESPSSPVETRPPTTSRSATSTSSATVDATMPSADVTQETLPVEPESTMSSDKAAPTSTSRTTGIMTDPPDALASSYLDMSSTRTSSSKDTGIVDSATKFVADVSRADSTDDVKAMYRANPVGASKST